jgi:hypothetical protein
MLCANEKSSLYTGAPANKKPRDVARGFADYAVAKECVTVGNYFGLIRADPGWPGTLKRLPVSVTSVPLTRRIEKS